jgi:type IV secretion system protein VirD4
MSSTQGRIAGGAGLTGFARRWWRWWMDTRGKVLGVVVPAVFTLVGWILDARLMPLALAGGLATGLLWPMGMAGRGLAITGGVVVLGIAFVVATGPAGILVLFVMLVGWGFVALLAGGLYLIFKRPRIIDPHYAARWATQEDTRDMVMWEEGHHLGEGVALGVHYGELVGVRPGLEGRREMGHFLVCGPSRSGKSLHLISNLLVWQGSAVALDIKGELFRLTAGIRGEMGDDVFALDPHGRGSRYDPFRELFHSPEALRSAVELVMETDKGRDPVFAQRGASALYAALLGAKIEGAPALAYVRELTAEGPMAFVERLSRLDDAEVRRSLIDFLGRKPEETSAETFSVDRFLSSTWSTMTARLQPVLSDGILRMTGGSDFEAADLVRRPSTLYLIFHEGELNYTRKILQVVMLSLVTGLIRHGDLDPNREGVPLLLALDEAGRTPIPRLDDMVSTIGGRGMSALVYVQDLGQLEAAYGRDEAQTIRGNCHNQVYYRPSDHDTATHVSRLCGQTSVEDVRVSGTFGEERSYGQRPRELITPDEVRQMAHEHVIVFAGRKPPMMAHRLEWFNLYQDAQERVANTPPPDLPELPRPEVAARGRDRRAEPEEQGPPPSDLPKQPRRKRREEEREEGEEVGGYVEPDV